MKKIEIYMAHSHEVFAYGLHQGLTNLNCSVLKRDSQGIDALSYIIESAPKIVIIGVGFTFAFGFRYYENRCRKAD